jgi:hypothetical protein
MGDFGSHRMLKMESDDNVTICCTVSHPHTYVRHRILDMIVGKNGEIRQKNRLIYKTNK